VRQALTFFMLLSCGGCSSLTALATRAPEQRQAAATMAPVTTAEEPRKFECSDGTISNSQYGCLVEMAKARLPPSQTATTK
jgi:hypothetical protein